MKICPGLKSLHFIVGLKYKDIDKLSINRICCKDFCLQGISMNQF